ncbi:MAG: histidine phosphatase family protein [Clostridia bacterium]|nr:histidine phosphatase family protein [Clostridia bacterium]
MLLYVIRHGDPDYSVDSLTPLGWRQAEAVGKRLASSGIDRVYSSPLGRAKDTAKPLCEMLHLELNVLDWLSEHEAWNDLSCENSEGKKFFVFNARPSSEFKSDDMLYLSNEEYDLTNKTPGMSVQKAHKRIGEGSDKLMADLGYTRISRALYEATPGSDQRIAVFCHEGASMGWLSYLTGIPAHIFWSSFAISHSAVSIFHFEPQGISNAKCIAMCDTSHIYGDGLPMLHKNHLRY